MTPEEVLSSRIETWELVASAIIGRDVRLVPVFKDERVTINMDTFISMVKLSVSKVFEINIRDLIGHRRTTPLPHARAVCYHILRNSKYLARPLSLISIAGEFGGRDHSTVLHGLQIYNDFYFRNNKNFKNLADRSVERLDYEIVKLRQAQSTL